MIDISYTEPKHDHDCVQRKPHNAQPWHRPNAPQPPYDFSRQSFLTPSPTTFRVPAQPRIPLQHHTRTTDYPIQQPPALFPHPSNPPLTSSSHRTCTSTNLRSPKSPTCTPRPRAHNVPHRS
ncbi:hypothetical protein K458DRAFT_420065 [Lentithecium fluviatile CBS 122367]|uniref:Uncharacterized protein n=1 Tax=Lentithecium fluviatile CBS 122367 TaxID=1168545 RepID=A0A6G1IVY4_9PLEO|nr:hypothetical protein K458DRAFT_420065 [Lentithecium fluviatile CBS 122367]